MKWLNIIWQTTIHIYIGFINVLKTRLTFNVNFWYDNGFYLFEIFFKVSNKILTAPKMWLSSRLNCIIERTMCKNETMSNELISLPINVKKSPTSINCKLQLQNLIKFLNRELNLSNNVNT